MVIWKKGIYEIFGNQKYYKHLSQQEKVNGGGADKTIDDVMLNIII